jgi:hypothetical protein
MEKTKYFAPECEEVNLIASAQILDNSTGTSEDWGEDEN